MLDLGRHGLGRLWPDIDAAHPLDCGRAGVICPPTRTISCPLSLCATIVGRLTFGGNTIETGTSTYRRAKRQLGGAKSSRAISNGRCNTHGEIGLTQPPLARLS